MYRIFERVYAILYRRKLEHWRVRQKLVEAEPNTERGHGSEIENVVLCVDLLNDENNKLKARLNTHEKLLHLLCCL